MRSDVQVITSTARSQAQSNDYQHLSLTNPFNTLLTRGRTKLKCNQNSYERALQALKRVIFFHRSLLFCHSYLNQVERGVFKGMRLEIDFSSLQATADEFVLMIFST
jgi:hypothetical protein